MRDLTAPNDPPEHAETQDQDSDARLHRTHQSPPSPHPDPAKEGEGAEPPAAHSRPNVLVSSTAISSFSYSMV